MVTNLPKRVQKYQLKLPSESEVLEIIRYIVSRVAKGAGFGEEDVNKIELAVDEACANVVKHAYRPDESERPISIDIIVDAKSLTVIVADRGKGFNLARVKTPDLAKYIKQGIAGGLGIHLMKSLMDEVDFEIKPGVGNQVRLVKHIIDQANTAKQMKAKGKR